jgi:hypothetical protein
MGIMQSCLRNIIKIPFLYCCNTNHLLIIKCIINCGLVGNGTYCDGFKLACSNEHLNVAKYLYSLNNDYDLTCVNDSLKYLGLFRKNLLSGNLQTVKWLNSVKCINDNTYFISDKHSILHAIALSTKLMVLHKWEDMIDFFCSINNDTCYVDKKKETNKVTSVGYYEKRLINYKSVIMNMLRQYNDDNYKIIISSFRNNKYLCDKVQIYPSHKILCTPNNIYLKCLK